MKKVRRKTHIAAGAWSKGRKLSLECEYAVTVLEEFVWGIFDGKGNMIWSCDAVKLQIEGITGPIHMDKAIFDILEREALT